MRISLQKTPWINVSPEGLIGYEDASLGSLRSLRMTGRGDSSGCGKCAKGCGESSYAAGARMASSAAVMSVLRLLWVSSLSLAPWLVR
jgi:hypothetical protein